jgi:class 3 adenylate cyclase
MKAFDFKVSQQPMLTIGIHQGYTIQGAIGSESKTDACYLSPHMRIV